MGCSHCCWNGPGSHACRSMRGLTRTMQRSQTTCWHVKGPCACRLQANSVERYEGRTAMGMAEAVKAQHVLPFLPAYTSLAARMESVMPPEIHAPSTHLPLRVLQLGALSEHAPGIPEPSPHSQPAGDVGSRARGCGAPQACLTISLCNASQLPAGSAPCSLPLCHRPAHALQSPVLTHAKV